jgi:hypothetical protein
VDVKEALSQVKEVDKAVKKIQLELLRHESRKNLPSVQDTGQGIIIRLSRISNQRGLIFLAEIPRWLVQQRNS